jgi:hypothetical protein
VRGRWDSGRGGWTEEWEEARADVAGRYSARPGARARPSAPVLGARPHKHAPQRVPGRCLCARVVVDEGDVGLLGGEVLLRERRCGHELLEAARLGHALQRVVALREVRDVEAGPARGKGRGGERAYGVRGARANREREHGTRGGGEGSGIERLTHPDSRFFFLSCSARLMMARPSRSFFLGGGILAQTEARQKKNA